MMEIEGATSSSSKPEVTTTADPSLRDKVIAATTLANYFRRMFVGQICRQFLCSTAVSFLFSAVKVARVTGDILPCFYPLF